MKITYIGTTMLLFDDGKDQLLFDCHTTRPSMLSFIFGKLSTDTAIADRVIRDCRIDRLKAIFISHSHHDHVMDAPYYASVCDADIYGSASALKAAEGGGIHPEKCHLFRPNVPVTLGDFRITVLPSVHSKAHWYNNDLGQTIDSPLVQPVRKKAYKEGGSYDFLIQAGSKTFLIRPSYNYIRGQLNGIHADVLFLGISGLSKDKPENAAVFFEETIDKVCPSVVIPVHWDNFLAPLYDEIRGLPKPMENTGRSLHMLAEYCLKKDISCIVQPPLSFMEIDCETDK